MVPEVHEGRERVGGSLGSRDRAIGLHAIRVRLLERLSVAVQQFDGHARLLAAGQHMRTVRVEIMGSQNIGM